MIKYKYQEETYALEILKNGFTSSFIASELKILVKYFKQLGHKPKEREELIYQFCEKYLDGYNKVLHYKIINSVLNYGKKKDAVLIQIDNVVVTSGEISFIDNLELNQDHKKILFTLLILSKLNKNEYEIRHGKKANDEYYFGGKESYYRDLKKRANVPTYRTKKDKNVNEIIYDLNQLKLTESVSRGVLKLNYLYEIPRDGDVVITVNNYDNIGLYYDLYSGIDKIKQCECCGVPIKVNNNKMKYCGVCAKVIKNENNKKYYHLGK